MKTILIILAAIVLSGCSIFSRTKPIEVITVEQERQRLGLDLPQPLSLSSSQWILVTPDNVENVWEQLSSDGKHPVLFAITSEGYEQLSMTMAEIRNYIATQRLIIIQYQNYYEPKE
jgi:hypothetical protein